MSEDRARILNLLAEGKITPAEAERLLDALAAGASAATATAGPAITGDPGPSDRGAAQVPLREGHRR